MFVLFLFYWQYKLSASRKMMRVDLTKLTRDSKLKQNDLDSYPIRYAHMQNGLIRKWTQNLN